MLALKTRQMEASHVERWRSRVHVPAGSVVDDAHAQANTQAQMACVIARQERRLPVPRRSTRMLLHAKQTCEITGLPRGLR